MVNALKNKARKRFADKVGMREKRMIKARREKGKGVWFGLGMMGAIGWSIAVPTIIGVAIGIWMDKILPGRISWTLTFLFVGLVSGCINAWYFIKKEQMRIGEEQNYE
jgi:ATP synthase protein I